MAEYTANYNLYKPNRADKVGMATSLSTNFQTIDTELKKNKDDIATTKSDLATQTTALQEDINFKTATLQEQFDATVIEGDSSVEAAQARVRTVGEENTSFPTLVYRLNDTDEQVSKKAEKQTEMLTVLIPSDYPTLQTAIDELSTRKIKQGLTITLQMESGYRPSKGIKVSDGDYSHFIITSVDAEVSVADDYTGTFLEAYRAKAPKLSCLINANRLGAAGVWLDDQSDGYVTSGAGVKNCYDRALYVNKTSRVWAEGSIWTGGRCQGLWVSRVSTAFVDYADFSGTGEVNPTDIEGVSVHISRQSRVYGLGMIVRDSLGSAVKVQRGSIFSSPSGIFSGARDNGVQVTGGSFAYIEGAEVKNIGKIGLVSQGASNLHAAATIVTGAEGNTLDGVLCENASSLDFDRGVLSGFGRYGLYANRVGQINASSATVTGVTNHRVLAEQGSTVNLRSATLNGLANKDISVLRGSFVSAFDCITTNNTVADTNVTAFNALSSFGVIFKS